MYTILMTASCVLSYRYLFTFFLVFHCKRVNKKLIPSVIIRKYIKYDKRRAENRLKRTEQHGKACQKLHREKTVETLARGSCSHSISRSLKLSLVFLGLDWNTVHVFYFFYYCDISTNIRATLVAFIIIIILMIVTVE